MLYRQDPHTLDHLVIDGDEILRLRTRAEALEVASRRCREARERQQATSPSS